MNDQQTTLAMCRSHAGSEDQMNTDHKGYRLKDQPLAQPQGDVLVSMSISVFRNGHLESDIQTHDNSYTDVAKGLASVKEEIERVFKERHECPYHPAKTGDAEKPIVRSQPIRAQRVPDGLIACLRGGRQCDEDGAEIIMSRQACCEAADILESLTFVRKD